MKFTCISASNVENPRQVSASTHTCELARDILLEEGRKDIEVDILRLLDYEPSPCRMCGRCFVDGKCARDPEFNLIFDRLRSADAILLVCPHYSPIPSKLAMVLEKFEEMVYLNACANPDYHTPLYGKPVAIIAHGGQKEQALPYYRRALLEPLAGALASIQMRVVGLGGEAENGVVFGIKDLSAQTDSVFVRIDHDWDAIRRRIRPLVLKLAGEAIPEMA